MCGIFGYIGKRQDAPRIVFEGLKRLEYRGYDSWGIVAKQETRNRKQETGNLTIEKHVGKISDSTLNSKLLTLNSNMALGHTRWATHGGVTVANAHPHYASDKSFALAQNGIVENYASLKNLLIKKGYKFETETDTEVIVKLIEDKFGQTKNLKEAVRKAFLELKGRNTVILITKTGQILAARNGSPLVVGVGAGGVYFSSDTLSFSPFSKKMIVIDNGQMVYCSQGKINVFDIKKNQKIKYKLADINLKDQKIDKEGYPYFMLKEIHEGPYAIRQLLNQGVEIYEDFIKAIKGAGNVYTIASGTTGIAAAQIAFYLRVYPKIKATSLIGAEAVDYIDLMTRDDLLIAPSQSGETADVLEILEIAKKKGVKIASYVNMQGSTMTRMSDYKLMSWAGPEICVMSTKVFVSQIAWGYLIAKIASGKGAEGVKNLKNLSEKMSKYLNDQKNHQAIKILARKLVKAKDIFLLGKYQNLNIIREGMVKLIEGTYKHAHAIAAGDLKHYAITLMEMNVPVIVAVSEDQAKFDVINAVNEVKARGAYVVGIAPGRHESFDFHLEVPNTGETSAVMNIIPLQLLAYYLTVVLGHNVDKPRNIAKSVTVK